MSRIPDVAEVADDVHRIEAHMATLMPRELFASEMRSLAKDVEALSKAVADVAREVKAIGERNDANRRLILSGLVLPILVMVIGAWLLASGATP